MARKGMTAAQTVERRERVRELGRRGVTVQDIMTEVNTTYPDTLTEVGVRRLLTEYGIVTSSNLIRGSRIDPNTILEGLIATSEIPPEAIAAMRAEWSHINHQKLAEWDKRLTAIMRSFRAIQGLIRMEIENAAQ